MRVSKCIPRQTIGVRFEIAETGSYGYAAHYQRTQLDDNCNIHCTRVPSDSTHGIFGVLFEQNEDSDTMIT